MGRQRILNTIVSLVFIGILLIVFGQNFDLVPRNRLFFPPQEKRDLLTYGNRSPALTERTNIISKYFLFNKNQPILTANDLSYDKASEKVINKGIENFLSDDEFKNSELGKTLKSIEERTRQNVRLWGRPRTKIAIHRRSDFTPNSGLIGQEELSAEESETAEKEILLSANQQRAAVVWKTNSMETTCGYSLQNQKIDLLFQESEASTRSFGLDYDRRLDASSVKMQMNW